MAESTISVGRAVRCRRCLMREAGEDGILCDGCAYAWSCVKFKRVTDEDMGGIFIKGDAFLEPYRRCGQCDGPVWEENNYLCEYHRMAACP